MNCRQARRLFGPYWDDETTQAEREWLESHLGSCATCRQAYEDFTRSLELVGSLPRIEPAPDLVERVLSRARRATPVPDRYPALARPWVPVTAAVVVLLLAVPLVLPWIGVAPRQRRPIAAPSPPMREAAPVLPVVSRELPGPAPGIPAATARPACLEREACRLGGAASSF